MSSPRYIVKVTDASNQEAFIGTFLRHERAHALAKRINAGITKQSVDGYIQGWASVVELEPNPGARAMVEWALGYPEDSE